MSKANIQVSIDNGRLMTKLAAVGLIFSVCFLILTAVIGSMRGGDVFRFGMITYALSAVFSFGALIYGMLSTQAGLENEEKQLLADRGAAENRALNVEEDVRFTAGRSFDNYRRFAPYALAILGALITGGFLYYFKSTWGARTAGAVSMEGRARGMVWYWFSMPDCFPNGSTAGVRGTVFPLTVNLLRRRILRICPVCFVAAKS